jgi:HEAT repeat protein
MFVAAAEPPAVEPADQVQAMLPAPRPKRAAEPLIPPPRNQPAGVAPPPKRVPLFDVREVFTGVVLWVCLSIAGLVMSVLFFIFVVPLVNKTAKQAGEAAQQEKGPARNADELTRLMGDLKSPDAEPRVKAAQRLQKTKPDEGRRREVAALLAGNLKDKNDATREAAARALVTWATRADVPALLDAIDDHSGGVRAAVMEALGNLKDERAVSPVALRLTTGDRGHAAAALQKMGPMAEKEVLKYLDDQDGGTRTEACKVLQRIGTRESLPALEALKARERDRNVQVAVQDALTTIKGRNR